MRGLSIALREAPLALTDSEAPQPLKVLGGVVSPSGRSTSGEGKCSEPFAEPQPARGYSKLVGCLANRERVFVDKHGPTVALTYRFI
jgi:hypothetical protein